MTKPTFGLSPLKTIEDPHHHHTLLTIHDLPKPGSIVRWVYYRKLVMVLAVQAGLMTKADFCGAYKVDETEFDSWVTGFQNHGAGSLRITRMALYRTPRVDAQETEQQALSGHRKRSPLIEKGDVVIDPNAREVTVKGVGVHLQPRQYEVLKYLAENSGRIIPKATLLDHLYSDRAKIAEYKIIDVFVCGIRKALGDARYIDTIWGRGYVFNVLQLSTKLATDTVT